MENGSPVGIGTLLSDTEPVNEKNRIADSERQIRKGDSDLISEAHNLRLEIGGIMLMAAGFINWQAHSPVELGRDEACAIGHVLERSQARQDNLIVRLCARIDPESV